MFGQLGQLAGLLRNAGKITQNVKEMNERLAAARFVGEAGGGQVRATVDGRAELVGLRFDPALLATGDAELVEELTLAAVRDAAGRSRAAMQQEMAAMTGGLDLGDVGKLLGP